MSDYTDNLSNMLCLDVYLSSLTDKEYKKISPSIKPLKYKAHPLLSADIYCTHAQELIQDTQKKRDLNILKEFQKKLKWETNLEDILCQEYYALVLTDAALQILWVNKQFTCMTGYSAHYAIGKSPKFLQGRNTAQEIKNRIRENLATAHPFQETLVNYRKNQEEYRCLVNIFPIQNGEGKTTHFLALETETD